MNTNGKSSYSLMKYSQALGEHSLGFLRILTFLIDILGSSTGGSAAD